MSRPFQKFIYSENTNNRLITYVSSNRKSFIWFLSAFWLSFLNASCTTKEGRCFRLGASFTLARVSFCLSLFSHSRDIRRQL